MAKLEIRFHEMKRDFPDEVYVRNEMKDWLLKKGPGTKAKVEFFSGPFENRIGCYIEVMEDGSILRNFEYGKGVPHTFFRCLEGLKDPIDIELTTNERSA